MVRRRHKAQVLSEAEVKQIRKQAVEGYTVRHNAAEFGVGHAHVHRLVTGASRRDVK